MPTSPRASDLRRSRAPASVPKKKNPSSGGKSFLRLSSSLQDLSSYSTLDLEDAPPPDPPQTPLLSDAPSFSKHKPTAASPRRCAAAASLALCLLSLLFLLYIFVLYLHQYRSRAAPTYLVVLDCGSTGTRVFVYESRVLPGRSLPISLTPLHGDAPAAAGRAYRRMETEPGLDKLVRNETGLRAAILPLLRWAEGQIPASAHHRTFVHLYATAGVRRLPPQDSAWILDRALEILKGSTDFVCRKGWVKTITGMEEAYFGWIALNYQMRMLGSTRQTLGALDLGGSSLQVTFENAASGGDTHSLSLHIGSVYHHLIAYSLSGYGLNDAFDKSVAHLLRKLPQNSSAVQEDGRLEIRHPCLNEGYREVYGCSQCVGVAGRGVVTENVGKGKQGIRVELVGTPHWDDCTSLAKSTVNLSEWSLFGDGVDCDIKPCALADNVPRPRGRFHAMSGFFVVFRFFNLSSDATLDDMLQKGLEFCGKTWEVAKNSVIPQPFIEQYCFRAPYVASLLRDGLHIRDSEVVIGSGSITWTLGVALVEAGQAFSKRMTLANYMMVPGSISPMVLVFMLLMSLMFLCVISFASRQMRNAFRRAYLPLFRRSGTVGSYQYFNSGDTRSKAPLRPMIVGTEQSPFITSNATGSGVNNIQLTDPTMNQSTGGVLHSYSYSSLSQVHTDNGVGSSWAPHRNKTRPWSRRSQSREDLLSTLSEIHMVNG